VQEYRKSLQQLREDLCRMYLKIGSPLSTLHLRQTLHRLKVSEMQVAPFSTTRPNMDEKAKAAAQEKEQQGEPLKSRLVVAVIGLSGAGKTSLINRLLDLPPVDPFEGGTKKCRVVDGEARGIPVRFIDSPGLRLGFQAQQTNRFKMIGAWHSSNSCDCVLHDRTMLIICLSHSHCSNLSG
jgi:tRNA U34 5-carboxymethylaminomethyl modifying GTPase MnmE/TrmE